MVYVSVSWSHVKHIQTEYSASGEILKNSNVTHMDCSHIHTLFDIFHNADSLLILRLMYLSLTLLSCEILNKNLLGNFFYRCHCQAAIFWSFKGWSIVWWWRVLGSKCCYFSFWKGKYMYKAPWGATYLMYPI